MRSALTLLPSGGAYTFQSNPVSITLSAYPCPTNASCGIDFFLSKSVGALNKSANNSEVVLTTCQRGHPLNYTHHCSNGQQLNVSCSGHFSGILREGISVGVVALSQSIVSNMEATISSAGSLNAAEIQQEVTVLISIASLALVILLSLYGAYIQDLNDAKEEREPQSAQKDRTSGADAFRLWEKTIPSIFSSKPFSERLYGEMKHHHKWFGVIFHYSESFSRPLRVLALSTKILLMLFFQSVTYDYTNPNDLSCEGYSNRLDCLREQTPFGTAIGQLQSGVVCRDILYSIEHSCGLTPELDHHVALWGLSEDAAIVSDLVAVANSTTREIRALQLLDKQAQQQRLLLLFQCDLLPGVTGINAPKWVKIIGYLVVFATDLGALFYVFLFALRQTKYRQDAWFRSFMTWLGLDIILVGSAVVLVSHLIVPSFAMRELSILKERLIANINSYFHRVKEREGEDFKESSVNTFNSAEYFFISHKIARREEFRHLFIAK
eukprot:gene20869-21591_t